MCCQQTETTLVKQSSRQADAAAAEATTVAERRMYMSLLSLLHCCHCAGLSPPTGAITLEGLSQEGTGKLDTGGGVKTKGGQTKEGGDTGGMR